MNPVEIAAAIRDITDRLEKSAQIIAKAYECYLSAKREYTIGLASARQEFRSEGASFNDGTDKAQVASQDAWLKMDDADVAYKYARDLADALEKKLSGLQTEARLQIQAYNVAGVG